jgi:hypothetical protein
VLSYGIFEYKELIEFEGDQVQFAKVAFIRDFGPFRKYECVDQIRIDFENLVMYELTSGGNVVRQCQLRLEPV